MAAKPLLIPFSKEEPHDLAGWGYTEVRSGSPHHLWRKNYVFDDGLALMCHVRDGHRVGFEMRSTNDGASYYLFLSEMVPALANCRLEHREIDGEVRPVLVGLWTFQKRGYKYSLKAVASGAGNC